MPSPKLRLLQVSLTDKSMPEYQPIIVRGRGLLARRIIQLQIASPCYTPVYAELKYMLIIKKIPQIGESIIKRFISLFR
ncbi:unnamed protein product [Rotaria sordida]|uniref:Uncharacterized protein n=1 Tax=Rotaria sordida TaxID=392033 RepID=A0A814U928_9BILA|nr:unnamed protein product [Rotaria sordida]